MQILDNIKKDIQLYFGRKNHIAKHSAGIVNDLRQPENLCMFFCADSHEELDEIRSVLKRARLNNTKVTVFVFHSGYTGLDLVTDKSIVAFDLNDFTLFGKMNENLAQQFEKEHFDLLISFTFKHDDFFKYLVSNINAQFKIGPAQKEMDGLYDLMISMNSDILTYNEFYNQATHYLEKLNIQVDQNQ